MTWLRLEGGGASTVEFLCSQEASVLPVTTELKFWTRWGSVAVLGAGGVTSRGGGWGGNSQENSSHTEFQHHVTGLTDVRRYRVCGTSSSSSLLGTETSSQSSADRPLQNKSMVLCFTTPEQQNILM